MNTVRIAVLCCFCALSLSSGLCVAQGIHQESPPAIKVQIFVRTDCPISNRYAPEVQRLQAEFQRNGVDFELVYPNADETSQQIQENLRDYGYHIAVERDPYRVLVQKAHATITPEAAVFLNDKLLYHGRIDDQVAAFGKVRPAATTHELRDAIVAALTGHTPTVSYAPAVGCYIADLR